MILNKMDYPIRFLNHQLRPGFLKMLTHLKVKIMNIMKDKSINF
jgi:hypothetical protein